MCCCAAQVPDSRQIAATVLLDDGKGKFASMAGSPFPLPGCENPGGVATGDLDGDGIEDFAVTCMGSDSVLLFHGKKGGELNLVTIAVAGGTGPLEERGIALADLTRSGRDDIILADPDANNISVLHWHAR